MKRIITICAVLLMTASVFLPQQASAQAPEKMSYQAVVRDGSNNLVTSTAVGMQISILQGSSSGTAVYVETQTPTSNANGLISIEIGAGTVVSGDFTTIDWANGPYFIKTETDPTGGTSYTITGTSQLLSVPYALHAKTAENVTGTITETDPVFGASVANGITAIDTANWNNHTVDTDTHIDSTGIDALGYVAGAHSVDTDTHIDSTGVANLGFVAGAHTVDTKLDSTGVATLGFVAGAHTVDTDTQLDSTGVANLGFVAGAHTVDTDTHIDSTGIAGLGFVAGVTQVTAGTNVTVTGSGTTASPYVVNATASGSTLAIGDSCQGGIIFWLDASGQHGLIAATTDYSIGIQWYNVTYRYTGTTGDGLYAGSMNTAMIVATQMADNQSGNFAAKVCADYSVTVGGVTYGDWYLPSKYELNLLYLQKTAVGGFASAYYWSSTEVMAYYACIQNFGSGFQNIQNKNNTYYVRAIRAF